MSGGGGNGGVEHRWPFKNTGSEGEVRERL